MGWSKRFYLHFNTHKIEHLIEVFHLLVSLTILLYFYFFFGRWNARLWLSTPSKLCHIPHICKSAYGLLAFHILAAVLRHGCAIASLSDGATCFLLASRLSCRQTPSHTALSSLLVG